MVCTVVVLEVLSNLPGTMKNASLQQRIAMQRARLADAKRRMKGRKAPRQTAVRKKSPVHNGYKATSLNVDINGGGDHASHKDVRFNSPSSPSQTSSAVSTRYKYVGGGMYEKEPWALSAKGEIRNESEPYYSLESSSSSEEEESLGRPSFAPQNNVQIAHGSGYSTHGGARASANGHTHGGLLHGGSKDEAIGGVYRGGAELVRVDRHGQPGRPGRVNEAPLELLQLQETLRTKQLQLHSAKEEVMYTGNLVNMLKDTVDKSEAEKQVYESKLKLAEDARLKSEAEVGALKLELEGKMGVLRIVQTDYETLVKDYDRIGAASRSSRVTEERSRLELELRLKAKSSNLEVLENSLDENRQLHQKTQLRLNEALEELRKGTTMRIDLNKNLAALECDCDRQAVDLKRAKHNAATSDKALQQALVANKALEERLNSAARNIGDRDSEALARALSAEAENTKLRSQWEKTKNELMVAFEKQKTLATLAKQLEQENAAMPEPDMVSQEKYSSLENEVHSIRAELGSATQLLLTKDALIGRLREELSEAEATTRSRRENVARRDSIAARQAATLSAQLQSATARLDVMRDTLTAKDKEISNMKARTEASKEALETNRKQNDIYLHKYEDTVAQKQMFKCQLEQTKEELEAKLYIVQQLNERLTQLETELTMRENEHRVSIPHFLPLLYFIAALMKPCVAC